MTQRHYRLDYLAQLIGARLVGNPECQIFGIMTLQEAQSGQLAFLDNAHYKKYLATTEASAVILRESYLGFCKSNALVVSYPYISFATIAKLFSQVTEIIPGIHPTAIISPECEIHPKSEIGPYVILESGCQIEEGVVIKGHCSLGRNVKVGAHSFIYSGVKIYHETSIGKHTIIHSGAVIGSDGFGFAPTATKWLKIPQLGKVEIGDSVEIGANVTIDRGTLGNTIIEEGVKLDNQVQIGHNVRIGSHTVIAGCTGIAGSTNIGKNCLIGGGVCINGHVQIADGTSITGMSSVVHSIPTKGIFSSTLVAQPHREWKKNVVRLQHLDKIFRKIKRIEKTLLLNDETN